MAENIEKLKEMYKDEWLAVEVTKEEGGIPLEGILIARGKDSDEVLDKAPLRKDKTIYYIYAGPPLKPGYGACFLMGDQDNLKQKISECEEKIKGFERKYGMKVNEFYEKLGEQLPLSLEHEGDYINWDLAVAELEELKINLAQ